MPAGWSRPVALAYHSVNRVRRGDDPRRLVTSPRQLESQVRWLTARGYSFLTAGELLDRHGTDPPPGTALLTFDDGWRDALTVCAPLLSRLGVRGTFYLNPGRWGERDDVLPDDVGRLVDRDDAAELHRWGMELGSHAMKHADLRTWGDPELAGQLSDSKRAIEDITGEPCRTLAYPFGLFDERVECAARDAGYELAFTWRPGPWLAMAAPRLPVPARGGAARLAVKLAGIRLPSR